jgi:hypothetical protein
MWKMWKGRERPKKTGTYRKIPVFQALLKLLITIPPKRDFQRTDVEEVSEAQFQSLAHKRLRDDRELDHSL